MTETDLQLGGGYTYQWECAILLALNYFFEPVRYNPTLFDLVNDFLGQVAEIHLEGEDRESGLDLEDINLVNGDRRILIQVKTKQAEGERWTPTDPLLLKALYRFYDSRFFAEQPDETCFVFLTNRPFNPALVRVKVAIGSNTIGQCAEADKLYRHLARYAQREKGTSIDGARLREILARTALVEYLAVDEVKANVQAKLQAHGRRDWQQAHALLFEHFARQSTRAGGGTVTRGSVIEVLGPPPPETLLPPHTPTPPYSHTLIPLQLPPRATYFTGRQAELTQLLADLQPGRVVTLCGPGGIGKTALAAEAIWTLVPAGDPPERFPDGIIFHTFYNQPQAALALEAIARAYGEEPRPNPAAAARRVLAGRRALLVLDGAEAADDLPAVLAVRGGCGVLVTSRARQDAVAGRQDLTPLPDSEAVQLLQAWGGARAADEATARRICELVGRLPLAVRMAGRYLAQREEDAADYLAWLQETPLVALDQGQRQRESVPLLLDRSIAQVSEAARRALGVVGLLALSPFGREAIAAALEVTPAGAGRLLGELVNYGLLLREAARYQVSHALVHTYARRRMSPPVGVTRRLAAYYTTLAEEQSALGLPGYAVLDAERLHLMAILAGCVAREGWDEAKSLAWAMHGYLDIQGHWTECVTAIEAGLAAARALHHRRDEEAFLIMLGLVYHDLGQVERAIRHYDEALVICREITHRQDEGSVLGNLGLAYRALGEVGRAIEHTEQALGIAREIGDRRMEGNALGNLGLAYSALGEVGRAIGTFEQALVISREIGDRRGEGNHLGGLGLAYSVLGEVGRAIGTFEQALGIAREIGDRRGEGNQLGNLGLAYSALGEVGRAIEYYEQALEIAREIGDRRMEGSVLGNLGLAYSALGEVGRAIECYEQALEIAREIGDRRNEGNWLGNLGNAYSDLEEVDRAIEYHEQALEIAREIGDRRGEGADLGNLGNAYSALGEVGRAIEYYQQALQISREIGDRRGEGNCLANMGMLAKGQDDTSRARGLWAQALHIYEAIQSPHAETVRGWLAGLAGAELTGKTPN